MKKAKTSDVKTQGSKQDVCESKEISINFEAPVNFARDKEVLKISTEDSLGLGQVVGKKVFCRNVVLFKFYKPQKINGKLYGAVVDVWRCDEQKKRVQLDERHWIEAVIVEARAQKLFDEINARVARDERERSTRFKTFVKMTATERDIQNAQWKVLGELYPETVASVEDQQDATAVFEAEANLNYGVLRDSGEKKTITRIMGRYLRQSARIDKVKMELSLHWQNRDYEKMRPQRLSDEIFKATGIKVKPKTVRRIHERLGLVTSPDLHTGTDKKV